jgi:DNA-binding MarR family transcriptional regulator
MSKRYANLLFSMQKDKNLHQLSREIDMTVSHLTNVTDQWEREGMLLKERKGREIELKITEFGKKVLEVVRRYDELATGKQNKSEGENKKIPQDKRIRVHKD